MSSKVEDYIREHRKKFDVETPSHELWQKIEYRLDAQPAQGKQRNLVLWMGVAASLTLICALAYLAFRPQSPRSEIARISPAIARKEMKFASLIDEKKDSLMAYAKGNPELYGQFTADLDHLGAAYEALRAELKESPNPRVVANAMVKNLRLQLQVINQQLLIINEVNEIRKEKKI